MLRFACSAALMLGLPVVTFASEAHEFHAHPIAVVPFAALLLSIALLPIFAERFWHSNRNKFLVAVGVSLPVLAYLIWKGEAGVHRLVDSILEYIQFIALLASLYAVSGGIVLEGDLRPSLTVNVGFLLFGAVLANLVGTTGASMLLIRPYLKINALRSHRGHLPVFFIFLVSNLGGLLTPLGDPPLFLGFLRGVDFFWTFRMWPQWLVAVGLVTAVFVVWEKIALSREPKGDNENLPGVGPLRLRGTHNFLCLAGILVMILTLSDRLTDSIGVPSQTDLAARLLGWNPATAAEPPLSVQAVKAFIFAGALFALSTLSMVTTPVQLRRENDFTWGAIIEVAVLFLGIFITMAPALALLVSDGHRLNIDTPLQFFWVTGILSSFLDNAPTYVSFATLAAGGTNFAPLMTDKAVILQAISAGAVFMGANTYIGNGPNFMVKAISDASGYKTPSFFGYMLYSGTILIPVFVVVTFLFFA